MKFESVEMEWSGPRRVPRTIQGVFQLVRPFTLLAPILGGVCAALLALWVDPLPEYEGAFSWPVVHGHYPYTSWAFPLMELVWGVGTLVLVNAASNTINQVYDLEIDRINKPQRPIPAGLIRADEAMSIAWILYIVVIWRLVTFANGAFAMLVLALVIMTILYSAPPVQFKKRLWASNLSIAVPRGLLGFAAGWCIFGDPFNPLPWFMGLILCLFLIGAMTTKDFTDMPGDAKFGMRTLPIVYGVRRAIILSAPFLVLPFLLVLVGIWQGILIPETAILLGLCAWGAYLVHLLFKEAAKPDPVFENSPAWRHMYMMLMAAFVGILLIYVVADYV